MSPVLVTGATGFLGRFVVAALLRQGTPVRAVVRPGTDASRLPWGDAPGLELARVDLRRAAGLADAVRGTDAVVHLAAAKTGDLATRFAGTVVATEHLLDAMVEAEATRLVFCSTFSVYDYRAIRGGSDLTETSPLEDEPAKRDEYAQVKLEQERLVRDWAAAHDGRLTVLRPGMIYGPDELWNALVGIEVVPPLWFRVGGHQQLPMTWVENVAEAFALATVRAEAIGQTLNVIDDDLPTAIEYAAAVTPLVDDRPRLLPIPYQLLRAGVEAFGLVNDRFLGGKAKLPGGFLPAPFHARFRPLRYPNGPAKQALAWTPRYGLQAALGRIALGDELLNVSAS